MAIKVVRKSSLKGPDELITSTWSIFKFLSDNLKAVVIVASLVGIVVLSYTGWGIYKRQRDQKAGDAYYSAMKVFQAKVDPAGTAPGTFKTDDERSRAAIAKFTELSKTFKGSKFEEVALLYSANIYLNLKEFDKAIETYNKMLFKIEREDSKLHGNINEIRVSPGIVRDSALYGLAYAHEQKGDLKNAIEFQTSLTSSKDSHLREMGLASLGRLYEKSGDKAKALETYKKIISEYPESSNLSSVKEKIERLKG